MSISHADFEYIAQMAHRCAAIVLEPGKEYLVESRLGALAQREGLASVTELVERLRLERPPAILLQKTIDALTTNETLFFRDVLPFEAMRLAILPRLIGLRGHVRQLSIWSAACSTGQEPYSIAMLIREHFPELSSWKISILATDLSTNALALAKAGVYSRLEVSRGLPANYLLKYFRAEGENFIVRDEIRSMIDFRPLNLIEAWPLMPAFDVVFIRNVMIYFDLETKRTILRRIRSLMLPHAYLFLGTAETTMNLDDALTPVNVDRTVVYMTQSSEGSATGQQAQAA